MTTAAHTFDSLVEPPEGSSASEPDNPAEPEPEPSASTVCADPGLGERAGALDLEWIAARLRDAVAQLEQQVRIVEVTVVGEPRIRELHQRHLGSDEATDVLAFSLGVPGAPIEADIAICLDVAAAAASERGHRVEQELLLYALHGLLHCAGHEDKTDEGFAAMHAEEDRILSAISVGSTFGRAPIRAVDQRGHEP